MNLYIKTLDLQMQTNYAINYTLAVFIDHSD